METRQHLEAVSRFLCEPKAGVHQHVLLGDAGTGGKRHALADFVENLVHDLGVDRLLIHVPRSSARVHQHNRHTMLGHDRG
jgi:hypothetical protein